MDEAPAPQAAGTQRTGYWCRRCEEPVLLSGPEVIPEFRKAVHAGTGDEKGPGHGADGWHLASPVGENPLLYRQAAELEREFPEFTIEPRYGFFRADWRQDLLPPGVLISHYEEGDAPAMRERLLRVRKARGRENGGGTRGEH